MTRLHHIVTLLAFAAGECCLLLSSGHIQSSRTRLHCEIFRLRGGGDAVTDAPAEEITPVTTVDDSHETTQEVEGESQVIKIADNAETATDTTVDKGQKRSFILDTMDTLRSNAAKAWSKKDLSLQKIKNKVQGLKDRGSWTTTQIKDVLSDRQALLSGVIWHFGNSDRPLTPLSVVLLTLLGSSLGFHSFLYFATVGYGCAVGFASMAGLIAYNIMSQNRIPVLSNVHSGLTLAWSIRLVAFLLHREFVNWPAWHGKTVEVNEKSRTESKLAVWITCASFYAALVAPCIYRLQAGADSSPGAEWGALGIAAITLQAIGLVLESISDFQKARFKAMEGNRHKWCRVGLWKYFVHPNYLGEVLFWLGVYLGGVGCYTELYQWTVSTLGLVFLSLLMRVANESLNAQQLRRYGMDEEYLEFRNHHSFLGPFRLSGRKGTQIHL